VYHGKACGRSADDNGDFGRFASISDKADKWLVSVDSHGIHSFYKYLPGYALAGSSPALGTIFYPD
jgi:hypothetical protein